MYYKSILILLKDENKGKLTITNEIIKDNAYFIEAYLKPKEIKYFMRLKRRHILYCCSY